MQENKIRFQCQYCGSIQDEDGNYDGIHRPLIREWGWSHGTCPECKKIMLAKIAKLAEVQM